MLEPARLSPTSRGVDGVAERVAAIENFIAWRGPVRIDFAVAAGPAWDRYQEHLEGIKAAMVSCSAGLHLRSWSIACSRSVVIRRVRARDHMGGTNHPGPSKESPSRWHCSNDFPTDERQFRRVVARPGPARRLG